MKHLPILLASTLFAISATSQMLTAEEASLADTLASEAKDTKLQQKASDAPATADEPEPSAEGASDTESLAEQVTSDLEKLLGGSSDKEVKKEDVKKIAEKAKEEGSSTEDIRKAVSSALTGLQEKGVKIEEGTLEFVQKSMSDILSAGSDDAMGDPASIYIQSLNAELEETKFKSDKKDESTQVAKADTQTETTKEPEAESAEPAEPSMESTKTESEVAENAIEAIEKISMSTQKGPKGTITVVRGESLSQIAARIYGNGKYYTLIYDANRDTLKSPNVVHVGQVLKIPPKPADAE